MKDPKQPSHAVQILGSMIVAAIIVIVTIAVVAPRVGSLPYLPEEQQSEIDDQREDGQEELRE
jgi:hypothetical protein